MNIDNLNILESTDSKVFKVRSANLSSGPNPVDANGTRVQAYTHNDMITFTLDLDIYNNENEFHYASYDLTQVTDGKEAKAQAALIPNGTGELPGGIIVKTDSDGTTFTFDVDDSSVVPSVDNLQLVTKEGYAFFDVLSFGQNLPIASEKPNDKGKITLEEVERVNDAFYRLQLEEDSDN